MKKLPPPITRETFEKSNSRWLKIIASGESGSVLLFPKISRNIRVHQLLNNKEFLRKHLKNLDKYCFLIVDFDIFFVEELADLEEFLTAQVNRVHAESFATFTEWLKFFRREEIQLVLFIVNPEKLFGKRTQPILFFLGKLAEENQYIQILLFFDRDITHPDYMDPISTRTIFFQNLVRYPLYEKKDIDQFVSYLGLKWDINIPRDLYREIYKKCGGHFWLVKQTVRHYRDTKSRKRIFTHGDINLRLEDIYNSLFESEKSVLKKIVFGKKSFNRIERHSLNYLQKMNLIDKNRKIIISLLSDYVRNLQDKETDIVIKNGNILFNNIPIDAFFSKKELRIFKELVNRKGEILTRDRIAKLVWPKNTEESYSNWAIDQLIARIRKRLKDLYISPRALETVRGRGYRFSLR